MTLVSLRQEGKLVEIDFLWELMKITRIGDLKLVDNKKDLKLKADVLIEILRPSSSLDEFQSIGSRMLDDSASQRMIKASEV